MIRVVAHRGLWGREEDQNTLVAIKSALDFGFGVETDLWAVPPDGVIGHDFPMDDIETLDLLSVLKLEHQHHALLALNVKSDGMLPLLQREEVAAQLATWDWFVFDMSIPETVRLGAAGIPFVRRVSDFEPLPNVLLDRGYWVDCFSGTYPRFALGDTLSVFVSPELHDFDPEPAWHEIRMLDDSTRNLAICTDFPERASEFFGLINED